MREVQQLSAEARNQTGKGPAYRARQKGLIPGVMYGGGTEPESVSLDKRTLERLFDTGGFLTTLFDLNVDGAKTRVIPRDVQLDPVTDRVVHVDFMRLPKGSKVRLAIPVHFKGQDVSPGLKRGGVLNIVRHSIEMLCPADNIPNFFIADLSAMDIHDTLHVSAIELPEGAVPVIRDRDFTIASVVAPSTMKEELRVGGAAATGDAAAEGAAAPAAGAKAPAAAGAKAPAKAPEKK